MLPIPLGYRCISVRVMMRRQAQCGRRLSNTYMLDCVSWDHGSWVLLVERNLGLDIHLSFSPHHSYINTYSLRELESFCFWVLSIIQHSLHQHHSISITISLYLSHSSLPVSSLPSPQSISHIHYTMASRLSTFALMAIAATPVFGFCGSRTHLHTRAEGGGVEVGKFGYFGETVSRLSEDGMAIRPP